MLRWLEMGWWWLLGYSWCCAGWTNHSIVNHQPIVVTTSSGTVDFWPVIWAHHSRQLMKMRLSSRNCLTTAGIENDSPWWTASSRCFPTCDLCLFLVMSDPHLLKKDVVMVAVITMLSFEDTCDVMRNCTTGNDINLPTWTWSQNFSHLPALLIQTWKVPWQKTGSNISKRLSRRDTATQPSAPTLFRIIWYYM